MAIPLRGCFFGFQRATQNLELQPREDARRKDRSEAATAILFAREFAMSEFIHHPVNLPVNNARNERAKLVNALPTTSPSASGRLRVRHEH